MESKSKVKTYHFDKTLTEKLVNLSQTQPDTSCGFLYGSNHEGQVNVTAACYIPEELKAGTFTDKFLRNRCMFPVGVDPVGVFLCDCQITECTDMIPMSMNSKLPEEFLCAHIEKATRSVSLYQYNRLTKAMVSLEHTEITTNPYVNYVMFRVSTTVQIVYKFSTKKAELQNNCANAVESVIQGVASGNVCYRLHESDVIIGSDKVIGAERENSLGETLKLIEKRSNGSDGSVRPKKPTAIEDQPKIVYVEMLTKLTNEVGGAVDPLDTAPFSPVIQYEKVDELVVTVDLPISSVVLAEKSETLDNLSALFYRSIVRQLYAAQHILTDFNGTEIPTLTVSHYWPNGMNFPLSLIQSTSSQDSDMVEWRKDLHVKLLLPSDRPFFKKANAYYFPCDRPPSAQLINPHEGLSLTRQLLTGDGAVHMVSGKYAYHHYMQDRFDDDKWGCAYRSLQTLVSWFRLQGYTTVDVPSHRDIQQTLVDIGDKESSFVGSRQWIGSTEVSFVLDKLLGVTSKILFVSSGADLANKGRELVQHFQTQGTPIMIGGGVLAHTILGVYYNDQTGDIKFLILDPHLTRTDEDLKYIQDKGWCGWKNADFWDASAYYNMCMPQRPLVL